MVAKSIACQSDISLTQFQWASPSNSWLQCAPWEGATNPNRLKKVCKLREGMQAHPCMIKIHHYTTHKHTHTSHYNYYIPELKLMSYANKDYLVLGMTIKYSVLLYILYLCLLSLSLSLSPPSPSASLSFLLSFTLLPFISILTNLIQKFCCTYKC